MISLTAGSSIIPSNGARKKSRLASNARRRPVLGLFAWEMTARGVNFFYERRVQTPLRFLIMSSFRVVLLPSKSNGGLAPRSVIAFTSSSKVTLYSHENSPTPPSLPASWLAIETLLIPGRLSAKYFEITTRSRMDWQLATVTFSLFGGDQNWLIWCARLPAA